MADLDEYDYLPDHYDRDDPNALWVPRDDRQPPNFFSVDGHHEVRDAINRFYLHTGFAMSIHNINYHKPSGKDKGKYVTSFTVRCACGGDYKPQGTGKRPRSSTKMTGCGWQGRCKKGYNEEISEFGWSFSVTVPHHNHNRAVGRAAFAQNRKRDEYLLSRIDSMYQQHDTASEMLNTLLAESGNNTQLRLYDIKNEVAKLRRFDLAGQTPVEALLTFLDDFKITEENGEKLKYFMRVKYDSDNRVQNLFFAHPDCFKIIKENPDCVQIDATYKCNKFNMPLLHLVGVTCHHTVYDIGFGFMGGENHEHYAWHIKAMYELFEQLKVTPKCFVTDHDMALKAALSALYPGVPQRRCIWHINQNILTASYKAYDLKKAWGDQQKMKELDDSRNGFMARWHEFVSQPTETQFWACYEKLNEDYADQPVLMQYIDKEQMPHFEEWAECFCRYFQDYGIRVTSRVEGSHYRIKSCLTFQGLSHLLHVVKDIHTLMRKQRHKYEAKCSAASIYVPTDAADKEFDLLKRNISPFALRQLKQQLKLAKSPDFNESEACSSAFTTKFGLPCKHFLHHRIKQAKEAQDDPKAIYHFKLAQIDQHWHLDPPRARGEVFGADTDVFRPLDPLKIISKGRPKGATSKSLPKAKEGKKAAPEPRELSRSEHSKAEQDSVRAPARKKGTRTIKRKVTEKVTEEEIVEEAAPVSSLDDAMVNRLQDMLREVVAPLQEQVAVLQGRAKRNIIDISDDESDEEGEEDRASDGEFPEPEQDLDELPEELTSSYGLRSKTPGAIWPSARAGGGGR